MHDPAHQLFPEGSIDETFGEECAEFFEKIVRIAPSILYVFDLVEMRNIWVNRSMFLGLGYSEAEIADMGSNLLATLMHPDDLARYPEHFAAIKRLRPDEVARFEYRMEAKDGGWRWLRSEEMAFTYAADGSVSQIVGSAHDISEEREREERITLLVREMNHRIKNLFTVIMSIISLTSKTKKGSSVSEVFSAITGRITALSVSQSLGMPGEKDEPVFVQELARQIMRPYVALHNIQITGSDPALSPTQSTSVAMVLHELATNAIKYGSLLGEGGTLLIDVSTGLNSVGRPQIEITWTETCAFELLNARAGTKNVEGFGSRLIQRSIGQVKGEAEMVWRKTGLEAKLTFPMEDY